MGEEPAVEGTAGDGKVFAELLNPRTEDRMMADELERFADERILDRRVFGGQALNQSCWRDGDVANRPLTRFQTFFNPCSCHAANAIAIELDRRKRGIAKLAEAGVIVDSKDRHLIRDGDAVSQANPADFKGAPIGVGKDGNRAGQRADESLHGSLLLSG